MSPITKGQWRTELRAVRQSMDDGARNRAAAGLATAGLAWAGRVGGVTPSTVLCCYLSVGREPATGPLLAALTSAGYRVFVPVCEPGFQLSWVEWFAGVVLARSSLAPVMEPVGERVRFATLGPVAGILLPALAVDANGVRLGQGGGYYDRFLAQAVPVTGGGARAGTVPTAAVVYSDEVFAAGTLPHDSLDHPVDYILTPDGARAAGGE